MAHSARDKNATPQQRGKSSLIQIKEPLIAKKFIWKTFILLLERVMITENGQEKRQTRESHSPVNRKSKSNAQPDS